MQLIALEFLSNKVFTALQHPQIKEDHYIQAFLSLCFGSDRNNVNITISEPPLECSIPLTHGLRLCSRCPTLSYLNHRDAWSWVGVSSSVCKDYLTVGVVVRRKWLGLVGSGGLMPREDVCEGLVVLSTLKFFISWATRPRPVQVGAPPDFPASSEAVLSAVFDATVSFPPGGSWDFWGSFEHRLSLVDDVVPESILTVLLGEEDSVVVASLRFVLPGLVLT